MHPQAGENGDDSRFAMRLSLSFGLLMLAGKSGAWWLTGSSAIFSDALESVIHVVAVAFAAFSLGLSLRPADDRFRYGYDRITFFSAGFEGAMIALAAVSIIATSVQKWITGIELEQLTAGTLIVLAASLLNLGLGLYLVHVGQRNNSLILIANGKHVLTDSWTSFGVVAGLGLVLLTGWKPLDPICAIIVALNILWSGFQLMRQSVRGLMDYADPALGQDLIKNLELASKSLGLQFHEMRYRSTGGRVVAEVHLLFPYEMPVGQAHLLATQLEQTVCEQFGQPLELTTHLEALEDHGQVHLPHYSEPRS